MARKRKNKDDEPKRRKEIKDDDLKEVMRRIAGNVKRLRRHDKDNKVPLQALAAEAKVAATTIWEIENEKAFNVKVHTLVTIARALGVELIDLLK